ncbi:MAG TPA: VOC family protein [Chloroflexota bacterium]|nr:VOC family protein [Chloroflexota bacterium]
MSIRRVVPDLRTDQIAESRDFYTQVLGMEVTMDMGWIVFLVSPGNPTAQVQLMTHDAAAPIVPNITIEVQDVDAVHASAVRFGAQIVYPLTDEPWGVRRFFVADPSGTVINVMMHASG